MTSCPSGKGSERTVVELLLKVKVVGDIEASVSKGEVPRGQISDNGDKEICNGLVVDVAVHGPSEGVWGRSASSS